MEWWDQHRSCPAPPYWGPAGWADTHPPPPKISLSSPRTSGKGEQTQRKSSRAESASHSPFRAGAAPSARQTRPASPSLPLAAKFSALVGRKWITGCLGRSAAREAQQQPRTHTHTQPYSIKVQLFLGPSQKSMLSEYISLMFTIGRRRNALSSIYSDGQPMAASKPRWAQPACRDACHSPGMLRKPLIRKPRPKKLRKFVRAAKSVLLHALFWLSLAGPLKVNPLSGTIIRNVNLGERGCLVGRKRSLKKGNALNGKGYSKHIYFLHQVFLLLGFFFLIK